MRRFTLGDHTFLDPTETGPLARFDQPRRQILGAEPPAILDGLVRESAPDWLAAAALREGRFCGHGEPTMTIFDLVIDGHEVLEYSVIADDAAREGANWPLLAVRAPDGEWTAIYRRAWEQRHAALEGVVREPLTAEECAAIDPGISRGRISVGFEYPCDASSRDSVSWMTIDALDEGDAGPPVCIVNAEMA